MTPQYVLLYGAVKSVYRPEISSEVSRFWKNLFPKHQFWLICLTNPQTRNKKMKDHIQLLRVSDL